MNILTAHLLEVYYEQFKHIEIKFTKELVQTTGLLQEHVQLKCGSHFWSCVLYAASFQSAKVVAHTKSGLLERLRHSNNYVSLRLSFISAVSQKPAAFFMTGHVTDTAPYKNSESVSLLTVHFRSRPPDNLIEIIGPVLDAEANFIKRKDERIVLTKEAQRKLNLSSLETTIFIQKVPRLCLLRELSFAKAKLIMRGIGKFLVNKEAALQLGFDDPKENVLVKGKLVVSDNVEGKKEMVVLSMDFDEPQIPIHYKIRINGCLNAIR